MDEQPQGRKIPIHFHDQAAVEIPVTITPSSDEDSEPAVTPRFFIKPRDDGFDPSRN